jgi:PhzF family phenazine biosynthesis protein
MPDLRYFHVDAFTARPFAGNPAAVVPLERWLPDDVMQRLAAELALSETAFFGPDPGSPGELRLRWFTPRTEVDLCGHATLASAHVLFTQLAPGRTAQRFHSRSGPLDVTTHDGLITLDFPARPAVPVEDPSLCDAVAAAVGRRPMALMRTKDLVAIYPSAADVRALEPDAARILALDARCLAVTAPGPDDGDGRAPVDFVSRFFAPREGIPEDPVTGSAHCILTPYWAARLGKLAMAARQVSPRGGELAVTLAGDRVTLAGRAVLIASGTLHLP